MRKGNNNVTNEKTFKASNGYEVSEENGKILVQNPDGNGLRPITNNLGDALREYFHHERDQQLGRVRWPENPDYVIYRDERDEQYDGKDGRCVRVLHEPSAIATSAWERWHAEPIYTSDAAARWYFTEGPGKQERTWEQAQIGEVWWLTVDGEESTYLVKGTSSGIPYFSGQKEYLVVDHARITAGRKLLNVDGSVTKGEQE